MRIVKRWSSAFELEGSLDQAPLLSALSAERKDLCGESVARLEDMLREKPERECKIAAQLSDALDPARCAVTFEKCVAAACADAQMPRSAGALTHIRNRADFLAPAAPQSSYRGSDETSHVTGTLALAAGR